MKRDWKSELIQRLILLVGGSACLGWLVGEIAWGLVAGLSVYLGWVLWQASRLAGWLDAEDDVEPPEAQGFWGEVFDSIYRLQRRHHRSMDKLQAVIDRVKDSTGALNSGIIMLDQQGNLEWWNRAAARLLGFRHAYDVGQVVTNLIRDPRFVEYFEQQQYKEPLEIPSALKEDCYLQFSITLYGKGSRLMLVSDVTRLHQLESMRKDFVANVSHEMRTPLTVITGYIETMSDTLLDEEESPKVRMWRRALGQMQEQSTRMQNLVSDLLLLSKLETANQIAEHDEVHLHQLLNNIATDAQALSGEDSHNITVSCDPDICLAGSEHELRSAFSNLIFNAVRYTPAEGRITISWHDDRDGGQLIVEDTGEGIEPQHIPRLTERFYRVDRSRSIRTGGTGLGLAIVKYVMIRHSARLGISSQLGKGSRFSCHFPTSRLLHLKNSRAIAQA
ncbi:phosphate regulon sensor histidine kinase PhoR [Endozoicomonadaceae bacterium StTr2]